MKTYLVESGGDICCNCEKKKFLKMFLQIRRDWKFHLSIYELLLITTLIIVICITQVNCNSIPSDDANSISNRKNPILENSANRFDTSQEDSSDGVESEDNYEEHSDENDYGGGGPSKAEIFKYYEQQSKNYSKTTPKMSHTPHAQPLTSTMAPKACSGSCKDKQALENAALDSFKKHLLTKLGMEKMPNITKAPKIPENMLEDICIGMKLPPESCTGKSSYRNYEYQSDGPSDLDEFNTDVIEEEEDVQYMSAESRIYAFPSSKLSYQNYKHPLNYAYKR